MSEVMQSDAWKADGGQRRAQDLLEPAILGEHLAASRGTNTRRPRRTSRSWPRVARLRTWRSDTPPSWRAASATEISRDSGRFSADMSRPLVTQQMIESGISQGPLHALPGHGLRRRAGDYPSDGSGIDSSAYPTKQVRRQARRDNWLVFHCAFILKARPSQSRILSKSAVL